MAPERTTTDGSRTAAAIRGACFGARAAAIFAGAEALAAGVGPILEPTGIVAAPLGVPGLLRLGIAWALGGALAGALVGLAAGGAPRSTRGDARLASLTALIPVVALAVHAIAVTPPVSRLAFVLAGCGAAAALSLLRISRPNGRVLAAIASPWTFGPWLVGLLVAMLDLERFSSPDRQALLALGWSALVLAPAAGIGAGLAGARPGRIAESGPRPIRSLAAALVVWIVAILGVVGFEGAGGAELPAPRVADPGDRPSVVLVTLDTVRGDHLSLYGYERDTSPELVRFASRATVFERAIAASDLTLSTHASLFTGLYAFQHGARVEPGQGARVLADGFPTLAETLRDAGYLTLGVVANPVYLAARYGVAQGFDHYDDRAPAPRVPELPSHLAGHSIANGLRALGVAGVPFSRAEESYRVADAINHEVFGLLEELARRPDPFFLFVNYMDAHWPYDPPPPYDTRYPGRVGAGEEPPGVETFRAARLQKEPPSQAQRLHMVSLYDGEIAYLDAALGRLFDRLEALGLLERSLVIVTADHGEAFGEHGLYAHGVSVYQDQVHVPLVIRAPGQTRGAVSGVWTSSVDLLPTILDAVGLPVPARLAGQRLAGRSLLGDDPGPGRVVMAESYPDTTLVNASPRFQRIQRAVFGGDRKLIVSSAGPRELYDLRRDPAEENDLHAGTGRAPRLAAALQEWLATAPARSGEAPPMDEGLRRRLQALGYAR